MDNQIRPGQVTGDERAGLPLHRRETYLDLRDDQNRQWAKERYLFHLVGQGDLVTT